MENDDKIIIDLPFEESTEILKELYDKLLERRTEIQNHLIETWDARISEIGWVQWFIERKVLGLDEHGEKIEKL